MTFGGVPRCCCVEVCFKNQLITSSYLYISSGPSMLTEAHTHSWHSVNSFVDAVNLVTRHRDGT